MNEDDDSKLVFTGRMLLKVVLTIVFLMLLALTILLVVSLFITPDAYIPILIMLSLMGIIDLMIFRELNKVFSTVIVDDVGINYSSLVCKRSLEWTQISRVRVFIANRNNPYGGSVSEPVVSVYNLAERVRLYFRWGTYDFDFFQKLLKAAAIKNVRIDNDTAA